MNIEHKKIMARSDSSDDDRKRSRHRKKRRSVSSSSENSSSPSPDYSRSRSKRSRSRSRDRNNRRKRSRSRSKDRKTADRWPKDGYEELKRDNYQQQKQGSSRNNFHGNNQNRGAAAGTGNRNDRNGGGGGSGTYGDEYMEHRRKQREEICERGALEVWGKSPTREDLPSDSSDDDDDDDANKNEKDEKHGKKSKKDHKKHKKSKKSKHKKSKKSKKSKKKKRKRSSSSSSSEEDSDGDDEWVEKKLVPRIGNVTKKTMEDLDPEEDEEFVGPQLPTKVTLTHKEMGSALLAGEGAAMAAFVADGKRIPRRGEIGLTSEEITHYEDEGWVMSGSRHRRMEAVRLRKENQIYSADEQRALAMFSKDERTKRENKILGQFRDMVKTKLKKTKD